MLLSKIRAGELDTRIVIEENTTTQDSVSNEEISSWSELVTVSAKRMTKGGRFGFEGNQQVDTNVEDYLIRYSTDVSGVDASMRFKEVDSGVYFYLTNVEIHKRERQIVLTGERKDN